eukprot:scaffold175810_cov33-Tisochrysis_lutea.AAC.2
MEVREQGSMHPFIVENSCGYFPQYFRHTRCWRSPRPRDGAIYWNIMLIGEISISTELAPAISS